MTVTEELKKQIWEKGRIVEGYDSDMYRKDACGAWIIWDKYGVQDNLYGWEIDHVYPKSKLEKLGFTEEQIWNIENLRPLQHQNNASKDDDYPSYVAVITSDGNKNKLEECYLVVNEKRQEILKKLYNL